MCEGERQFLHVFPAHVLAVAACLLSSLLLLQQQQQLTGMPDCARLLPIMRCLVARLACLFALPLLLHHVSLIISRASFAHA